MKEIKDIIKIGDISELKTREIAEAALAHAGMALCGFIFSRAVVFGSLMPFGLALLAGCMQPFAPAVAIGTFFGYFIPAVGNGGFRYIAALLAVLAIRLMLSGYKKISENPFFLSFIAFAANAITGAVTLNGLPSAIVSFAAESFLAAGGAFFICRTSRAVSKRFAGLSGDEMAGLLIVISIMLMGIWQVGVYKVSLGRILGVFLILTCAKYGGTLSGSVSGIAVSFSAALTGTQPQVYALYSFAGMMTGLFSPLGKYAQLAAFWICSLISLAMGGFENVGAIATETVFGSALFLALPRNAGIELGKLFSCYPKITTQSNAKKALSMRLSLAAGALGDISETVEQVAKELGKINSPDFSKVISGVEADACNGCKLRIHCWESRREGTVEAILEMTKAVKSGESGAENYAGEEFKGRCIRLAEIGRAVERRYSDYAIKIGAENRLDEVRGVVTDQFDGISDMLNDLAENFERDVSFSASDALNAAAALKNIDIRVDECNAAIDKYGRMNLEMKLKKETSQVLNRARIMKALSLSCERNFDIPTVSNIGQDTYITVSERAEYRVDVGVNQICASDSNVCGDACRYFNDGKGHFLMILSDGMGTGGRAAVDSAMASGLMSRLLKAGFGYDCSLRLLNSSMLFKSTDESLATVDIASIDLFTGETELYKAGAAPTVVRRSGITGKAESTSLPIGILRDIGFDKAAVMLKSGDILLMMSDGAVSDGAEWIRAELEAWRDGGAQQLAEHISDCALRRRNEDRRDDITVMTAIIEKAV